jgi:hypothetical protein
MGLFSTIGTALGTAVGGPVGGTIGSALGGKLDTNSAQKQERAAADRANAWSKDMSDTAYQRAMADMKKAGLNPILAGRLGGASTPAVQRENILTPAMMSAEASMIQANTAKSQMQANVGKIDAEIDKIAADIGLTKGQTALLKETANLYSSQAIKAIADAGLSDTQQVGKSLQNTLDSMFVKVMKDHEFVYTAHKMNMGPGQLVDLLKTIIGKTLPNINVIRKDK